LAFPSEKTWSEIKDSTIINGRKRSFDFKNIDIYLFSDDLWKEKDKNSSEIIYFAIKKEAILELRIVIVIIIVHKEFKPRPRLLHNVASPQTVPLKLHLQIQSKPLPPTPTSPHPHAPHAHALPVPLPLPLPPQTKAQLPLQPIHPPLTPPAAIPGYRLLLSPRQYQGRCHQECDT
jgi:hypothetical protein